MKSTPGEKTEKYYPACGNNVNHRIARVRHFFTNNHSLLPIPSLKTFFLRLSILLPFYFRQSLIEGFNDFILFFNFSKFIGTISNVKRDTRRTKS